MNPGIINLALRYGAILFVFTGLFFGTWSAIADQDGPAYRYWIRYTSTLERKLRPMFIFTPGRVIALGQVLAAVVVVALALTMDLPFWWAILVLVMMGPIIQIEQMRRKRALWIETLLLTRKLDADLT